MHTVLIALANLAVAATGDLPECTADPEVSAELQALYDADQQDRKDQVADLKKRDKKRIAAVEKIDSKNGICTLDDHFNAAVVLYHSTETLHHKRASDLAVIVAYQRHPNGAWLVSRTVDRLYVSQSQPQKYGTQFVEKKGHRCLVEVDEAFTDQERAAWKQPPLAEVYQKYLDAAGIAGPPTGSTLRQKGLICPANEWTP